MKRSETFTTVLTEAHAGTRIDLVLSQVFPEISRNQIQNLIKAKKVLMNGKVPKPRDIVEGGEEVSLEIEIDEGASAPEPQAIALDILYEDDDLLIVNKSAGMVVHPGAGNPNNTLMNALLYHYPPLKDLERAGIVHRLDKETSGALVIAKNEETAEALQKQFAERTVTRVYQALLVGELISGRTVDAFIGRNPHNRKKMMITEYDEELEENPGKEAITHIRVLERFREHTLVECHLETGRTHQIRVHMQHINLPIVGDPDYGSRLKIPRKFTHHAENVLRGFRRQALHAYQVGFIHPKTGEEVLATAPVPKDMTTLIDAIREDHELYVKDHF